jgi:virginiamycin A acetyltransferase
MYHVTDSNIFEKADWLKGEDNFEAAYYDEFKNVYVEAPICPYYPSITDIVSKVNNVLIGRNTYKFPTGMFSPNVIIGRYCSISQFVFIGATHHHMDYLSTGFLDDNCFNKILNEAKEQKNINYTEIGCDVWIGVNALILGGAKIAHGACIGAGSVVKKEIPPYAIAVGNPARVIKQRFSDEIVADLLDLKWWTLEQKIISTLPYEDIKECIKMLKDIRKAH